LGDDVGHCKRFAGAGDAHEGLELLAAAQTIDEAVDSLGLIACGFELDSLGLIACGFELVVEVENSHLATKAVRLSNSLVGSICHYYCIGPISVFGRAYSMLKPDETQVRFPMMRGASAVPARAKREQSSAGGFIVVGRGM